RARLADRPAGARPGRRGQALARPLAGHLLLRVRRPARADRSRHDAGLKLAALIFVALAVLVAVAPSPGQTSDRRERPDIRWLRQWGAWEEDIRPQLIDLGGRESYVNEYPADAKERDELARDLAKLWTCDGFDARVPPAPARFAGGMASSIDFCS